MSKNEYNLISTNNDIAKESIGKSYENRDIWIYKRGVGENKPIIFILGTQHAREWMSPMCSVYILEKIPQWILDTHELHVIPVVNPDGYIYTHTTNLMWRKNRQPCIDDPDVIGTDLNRNWGPDEMFSHCPFIDFFLIKYL